MKQNWLLGRDKQWKPLAGQHAQSVQNIRQEEQGFGAE